MQLPPANERHSLDSLIEDIEGYIAEQETFARTPSFAGPGGVLQRSDSRGTMFVDVDERGGMEVSWRGEREYVRRCRHRHHHCRHSSYDDGLAVGGGEEDLPEEEVRVVDSVDVHVNAPRYIDTPTGIQLVRVAFDAQGRALYVKTPVLHALPPRPRSGLGLGQEVRRKPLPTPTPDPPTSSMLTPSFGPSTPNPNPDPNSELGRGLPRECFLPASNTYAVPRERRKWRRGISTAVKQVVRQVKSLKSAVGKKHAREDGVGEGAYYHAGYYV